jgi:hypothetical protein
MAPLCRDGAHRDSRLQGVSDRFVVEKLDPSIEASGSESAPGWAQPIRKWGRLRPSSEPDHGAARLRHRSVTTWRLAPRPNLAPTSPRPKSLATSPLAPLRVRTPRREIGRSASCFAASYSDSECPLGAMMRGDDESWRAALAACRRQCRSPILRVSEGTSPPSS